MSVDRVAQALRALTGLDPDALGRSTLAGVVDARRSALGGASLEDYASRVEGDAAERDRLVADLLVHETSFFRYPASFDALVRAVQERLADRSGPVRILSAACSTGQEPASAVMALWAAGVSPERLEVHAVDLSPAAVDRARRGLYGRFEGRGLPAPLAARWGREEPEGFRLAAEVRDAIRWRAGDLLDPAFGQDEAPYDVVLCRNLLIYLTADARARLVRTLRRLLRPDGLLFVGHAEVLVVRALGFGVVEPVDAYVVAPSALPERVPSSRPPPPPPPARASEARRAPRGAPVPRLPTAPPSERRGGAEPDVPRLARARRLADEGRLAAARALVEEDLRDALPTAEHFHLLALLDRAEGRAADAETALVKALYLDPSHVPSLVQAALAAEERGDASRARLLRDRLARAAAGGRT